MKDFLPGAERVLDVGCGSGFLMAAMFKMMTNGRVYGIEHIPELVEKCRINLSKFSYIITQ
jgi:protein-L-isoaspartate(D-aspartate) O-methyltransferase